MCVGPSIFSAVLFHSSLQTPTSKGAGFCCCFLSWCEICWPWSVSSYITEQASISQFLMFFSPRALILICECQEPAPQLWSNCHTDSWGTLRTASTSFGVMWGQSSFKLFLPPSCFRKSFWPLAANTLQGFYVCYSTWVFLVLLYPLNTFFFLQSSCFSLSL